MKENENSVFLRFLRWSERHIKTDMVYLVQGGSWLGIAQIAASAGAFITTLVLANVLDPILLGEYRFLIAGFGILCILALPGTRTALRESTPKGYRGNLTAAFSLMQRWGTFAALAALGIATYYFINENVQLTIGFLIIALALPFNHAATAYLEYLTALKELRKVALYTLVTRVALVITILSAVFLFPQYAWAILAAFLLGSIIPNLIFHQKTKKEFIRPSDVSDPGLPRYAKHLSAMSSLDLVAGQLDKVFVWTLIGPTGLALFYIAHTLPQEIMRFLGIAPILAFAKFGARRPHEIRKTLLPKLLKYLVFIGVGVGVYILIAPYLFALLFPKYPEAVMFSQVLALAALGAAFLPIKTYLTTIKATKSLYILSLTTPAIRIGSAIVLISIFGVWGAVYSLLIETFVRSALLLFFFLRTPTVPSST